MKFRTFVGEQQVLRRSEEFERLCEELRNTLTVGAWPRMTKSPARKLDQDAIVCPWNELREAASTPGKAWWAPRLGARSSHRQLCLDCGVAWECDRCPAARTRVSSRAKPQRALVREALGTDETFADSDAADQACERLVVRGVEVSCGQRATGRPTCPQQQCARTPPVRLAGRITKALETIEATRLWKRARRQ